MWIDVAIFIGGVLLGGAAGFVVCALLTVGRIANEFERLGKNEK